MGVPQIQVPLCPQQLSDFGHVAPAVSWDDRKMQMSPRAMPGANERGRQRLVERSSVQKGRLLLSVCSRKRF